MRLKDASILGRLARLFGDRRGAVSPLFALLLIPLIGGLGLAVETSSWYYTQRSMQNAADAAVMAAATNGAATYDAEAKAAATKYGFTDGASNTTVTPAQNQPCPTTALGSTCYQVTITKTVPIAMAAITGFTGSTALGGGRGQVVTAVALANQRSMAGYCASALSSDKHAFTTMPQASPVDFGGCNIFTNGSFFCPSGSTFDVGTEASVTAPNGSHACDDSGITASASTVTDPYAALSNATNIPATACSPGNAGVFTNSQTIDLSAGDKCYASLAISGAVTVNTSGINRVIRIYGGGGILLNAGASLTGPTDAGLTIVFTGATNQTPGFLTGTGTLTMSAPTTGTWAGMALYQDHRMQGGALNIAQTINATGLIYMPKIDLNFEGHDNYSGSVKCAAIVANTIAIGNHAGFSIDTTKDCLQAGLTLPKSAVLQARQALVQ